MATRATRRVYDRGTYRKAAAAVRASGELCWRGCGRPGVTADHVPPLSSVADPREWVGELLPACQECNYGHRRFEKARTQGTVTYRRG